MARLVRRQPLLQRLKSRLNPLDFLLWLSEEIDTSDWERWERTWAIPFGITLNIVFLIARANCGSSGDTRDDIFGEDKSSWSFFSWLASFVAHFLALVSFFNAFYTFWRKRYYRLFENEIEKVPSTPSAHRVQVHASPMTASPAKIFSDMIGPAPPEKDPSADAECDVWELTVWDPHPLSVRLFCFFSPGHVLVYWMFLPTTISDPQPSITIVMTLVMALILSAQMTLFSASYAQQSKDTAIVHREVFHEYDTKYVRPRTQPIMRNASTQFSEEMSHKPSSDAHYNTVETFTPDFIRRQPFKVNPNPKYVHHIDPEGVLQASNAQATRTAFQSPLGPSFMNSAGNTPFRDQGTPSRTNFSTPSRPQRGMSLRRSAYHTPGYTPGNTGDGGSLGAFTHANSPVKKSTTPFQQRYPAARSGSSGGVFRGTPLRGQPAVYGTSPSTPLQRRA